MENDIPLPLTLDTTDAEWSDYVVEAIATVQTDMLLSPPANWLDDPLVARRFLSEVSAALPEGKGRLLELLGRALAAAPRRPYGE
jgi:hypothetical protein